MKDDEQVPMQDDEQEQEQEQDDEQVRMPPYTAETDVSEGIPCYLCYFTAGAWAKLMNHMRKKHKIRTGAFRGTFFHFQASLELAAAQQERYTNKRAARAKSRVQELNAQPVIESTTANFRVQVKRESRSNQALPERSFQRQPVDPSTRRFEVQHIPCMWKLLPLWVPRDLEHLDFLPLAANETSSSPEQKLTKPVRPPITDGAADEGSCPSSQSSNSSSNANRKLKRNLTLHGVPSTPVLPCLTDETESSCSSSQSSSSRKLKRNLSLTPVQELLSKTPEPDAPQKGPLMKYMKKGITPDLLP